MEPPIEEVENPLDGNFQESTEQSIERAKPTKKPRSEAQLAAFQKCQDARKLKITERSESGVSKQKNMRIKKDDMIQIQEETINKQKALIETYDDVQKTKPKESKPKTKTKKLKKRPPTPPPSSSEESEESEESESEEEEVVVKPKKKSRAPKKAPIEQAPPQQSSYHIRFV